MLKLELNLNMRLKTILLLNACVKRGAINAPLARALMSKNAKGRPDWEHVNITLKHLRRAGYLEKCGELYFPTQKTKRVIDELRGVLCGR